MTWAVLGHLCVTQAHRLPVSFPQIPEKSCLVNKQEEPQRSRRHECPKPTPWSAGKTEVRGTSPEPSGFGSTDTTRTGSTRDPLSPTPSVIVELFLSSKPHQNLVAVLTYKERYILQERLPVKRLDCRT